MQQTPDTIDSASTKCRSGQCELLEKKCYKSRLSKLICWRSRERRPQFRADEGKRLFWILPSERRFPKRNRQVRASAAHFVVVFFVVVDLAMVLEVVFAVVVFAAVFAGFFAGFFAVFAAADLAVVLVDDVFVSGPFMACS